jgi:hypothetical protein
MSPACLGPTSFIVTVARSQAPAFDLTAVSFGGQPPPFGSARGVGSYPGFWTNRRPPQQTGEAFDRIPPILLLGAKAKGLDDQYPFCSHLPAGQSSEARQHPGANCRRVPGVETQMHGGCNLVYILAARPGTSHEFQFDFFLLDFDIVGDDNHIDSIGTHCQEQRFDSAGLGRFIACIDKK